MSEQRAPSQFPSAPLRELASRITDDSHFSPTPQEHGYLIANVKDMKSGFIDFSSCTRISGAAYRELKATGCTIRNGNVLLSKDGTVGRVVVYQQDDEIGALSSICIIVPTEEIDSAYLGHALQSEICVRQFENFMSGSALRRLVLRDIRTIEIPVPSVEQQAVIAQILDTLDTAIRATEALIDKLKAVKQGLLHDLLTRGIDANGQLRPPQSEAPQLYKGSPLGWIPREWECTAVAAIADVKSGATPSRAMAHLYYAAMGINWVKTLDLNEDLIFETDERITAQGLRGSSCVEFPAGTVLVAMYGGWEQIGRTGLLAVQAATNQAISALLFRTEHVFPEFILRAMQHGRPRWQQVAASTRKDPNITKTDVVEFLLPVPPKPEQEMIAGRYRSVLDQLQIEQQQALKLKQQKSGLMDDLLTGRVRVTPLLESVQQAAAQTGA